jgi:hypothetical protein
MTTSLPSKPTSIHTDEINQARIASAGAGVQTFARTGGINARRFPIHREHCKNKSVAIWREHDP